MKRHYLIASHSMLAAGLTDSIKLFVGEGIDILALTAYVDNKPIDNIVQTFFSKYPDEDEIVVMTDIMAGSVNQKMLQYTKRKHTHIITGMNLPLALALVMEPKDKYISQQKVAEIVNESQKQIIYMNTYQLTMDEDDE